MAATSVVIFERNTYSATHTSGKFANPGYKGVMLFLNVFTASGTGGLIPQIRRYDPLDGTSSKIIWGVPLPVITTGTFDYFNHPDANEAHLNVYFIAPSPVPEQWAVTMTNRDGTPYEYSMTGSFVP